MYIVNSYTLAVVFCFITMICWGSWGNTQKLASKNWRYELYYWDYTIGILLFAFLLVFTLGSFGDSGRSFIEDIQQVESQYIISALIGGIIFNASNILLSASVSIAGMAVAISIRSIYQLLQFSQRRSALVIHRSDSDCYRNHLQWYSSRKKSESRHQQQQERNHPCHYCRRTNVFLLSLRGCYYGS